MLEADIFIKQQAFLKRTRPKPKPRVTNNSRKRRVVESNCYHFIAYVPIEGHLWSLDGLRRNPVDLGEYEWEALS